MIELINVCKNYIDSHNENTMALKNVNFKLEDTGLVFIYGHSGSGKSTLLNIMAGLDTPSEGVVNNSYESNNFYSIIFQDYQLINYLTIKENLLLVCDIINDSSKFDEYVNKYGLNEILNHYPNEISGGQKQRVAIVRALLLNRPVIFCDEPTGNLDETNSVMIAEALKEESNNKLVIVVSHDMEIFEPVADRMISLKKGEIISDKINNDFTNICNVDEKNVKLKLKTIICLILNFFRKNKFKHILLVTTLFLSMILLISSFNGLNQKEYAIYYNAHSSEKTVSLDLYKGVNMSFQKRSLSLEERDKYLKKYGGCIYSTRGILINGIYIDRMYISSNVQKRVLYGNKELMYGEIAISDYVATKFSDDISNLIGTEYDGYKIASIYDTGYLKKDKSSKEDYLEKQYLTCYINKETYDYYILANQNTYFYGYISNDNSTYGKETFLNVNYYNDKYNTALELNSGEIYLDELTASIFSNNTSELIGNKITIVMNNVYSNYHNKTIKYTYEYTVKGIFNGAFLGNAEIALSESDYAKMSVLHNIDDNINSLIGISLTSYSKNDVKELFADDFYCDTCLVFDIDNGTDWLEEMTYVLIAISVVVFLICLFVIINFIHIVFEKEKRTQGVLTSFGIKKNHSVKMYYYDILISVIIPFVIAIVLEPIVIFLLNLYLKNKKISAVPCYYLEMSSVLIITLIYALILLVIYLFIRIKISKKNIIDIIYER